MGFYMVGEYTTKKNWYGFLYGRRVHDKEEVVWVFIW